MKAYHFSDSNLRWSC